MQAPAVHKIVINIGMGEAIQNAKAMDNAVRDLSDITGQRPVITKARALRRIVQAARGHAHRLHGDAARNAACMTFWISW